MLSKLKQQKESGFTIIEVMIVLAIAGLMMLVVFLAVPALQRNARNTTMKADASSFAAGFSEFGSNNDGAKATTITQTGSKVAIKGATGTTEAQAKISGSTTVTLAKVTAAPTTYSPGTLYWGSFGKTCDGSTSNRAIVVYYWTESSTAPTKPSCVDAS